MKDSPLSLVKDVLHLFLQIIFYTFESIFRKVVKPKKKSLVGEIALVTGAGHGLGQELALGLSKLGVQVACWDINKDTCEETVKIIKDSGGEAIAFQCDVSDREQVANTAKKTREKLGRPITMLFNNAGILNACKPFEDISSEEIQKVFGVNVYSQFWMLSEFLPDLKSTPNGGHLVCICSTAGLTGTSNLTAYCSTKYALNGLMEALQHEYRDMHPKGRLKMTTVYPATINTGLAKKSYTRFPWLVPLLEARDASKQILEAVQRNERKVYLPPQLEPMFCINHVIPHKLSDVLQHFIGVGVHPHSD